MNKHDHLRPYAGMSDDSRHRPSLNQPVTVIAINDQRPNNPHGHDFHELVVITSGSGQHVTKAGRWPCAAGDIFVLDPGYRHHYTDVDNLQLINVLIYPLEQWFNPLDLMQAPGWHALFTVEPRLRQQHHFKSRLNVGGQGFIQVVTHLKTMENTFNRKRGAWRHRLVMQFHGLLQQLVNATSERTDDTREELMALSTCIADIESNLQHAWTIEELCERLHCSPSTLQRTFKHTVGMAPSAWILERRLAKACQQLNTTNDTITAIAHACGFDDSNYFSRQFKKVKKVTPREYRHHA